MNFPNCYERAHQTNTHVTMCSNKNITPYIALFHGHIKQLNFITKQILVTVKLFQTIFVKYRDVYTSLYYMIMILAWR